MTGTRRCGLGQQERVACWLLILDIGYRLLSSVGNQRSESRRLEMGEQHHVFEQLKHAFCQHLITQLA